MDKDMVSVGGSDVDLIRHRIEFDPKKPEHYRFAAAAGSAEAVELAAVVAPDPIPWPEGLAPAAVTLDPAPVDTDPLPAGDVLVVTYTVAEGYALADVLTPGVTTSSWTAYRNGWTAIKAMIEGDRAPALGYDRAGLWAVTQIGDRKVVLVKSDLHPSTDGPNLPMGALWAQMIGQVQPKLIITTGTAGAVQADTLLGDVVVARNVKWDCTEQFKDQPWATTAYSSPLKFHRGEFVTAQDTLIPVNATHLPAATRTPHVHYDATLPAHVITTDFFAFDDVDDSYGLRTYDPDARAVEMDDAALALACTDLADPPPWLSIRNASDPQMDGDNVTDDKKLAGSIYEEYGYWTSIGSAISCWASVVALDD